jgi:hypothetical protein
MRNVGKYHNDDQSLSPERRLMSQALARLGQAEMR